MKKIILAAAILATTATGAGANTTKVVSDGEHYDCTADGCECRLHEAD